MSDQTPLDVEAIRENIRLYELDDGGAIPAQGEYTDSDLAVRDIRRLLDENARLNTEMAARDRTVEALSARLTAKNAELDKVIREAAADKARIAAVRRVAEQPDRDWQRLSERMPQYFKPVDAEERARRTGWKQGASLFRDQLWAALGEVRPAEPAPEMPRPPAEEGPTEEQRAELIVGLLFGEPGTANESAQEPVSGPETAGTGSGRGTGVGGSHARPDAVETVARILVGTDWDDGVRITDIGSRETVARMAEQIVHTLLPVPGEQA